MPPPPFWITMIRSDGEQFLIHKALESYRKLLSPTISVVIPSNVEAAPMAVEVQPSMPLVPPVGIGTVHLRVPEELGVTYWGTVA